MKLRVHHILCTNLYRGLGYDGPFCQNMTEKVNSLRQDPNQEIILVAEPDDICKNCPNLRENDYCANGDNHVCVKDRALLEPLHLVEGATYRFAELEQHARDFLTQSIFLESCGSCEWYKCGVCKFEDFYF